MEAPVRTGRNKSLTVDKQIVYRADSQVVYDEPIGTPKHFLSGVRRQRIGPDHVRHLMGFVFVEMVGGKGEGSVYSAALDGCAM